MITWNWEHSGTERAVRSKMARIKKERPRYFIQREWKISQHVHDSARWQLFSRRV